MLAGRSGHVVKEPADRKPIRPGHVYLAPRDLHLLVEDSRIRLQRGPKEHFTRPAVDPLFRSLAASYGPRVVGIVLTGGGRDGLDGLMAIKAAGGYTIAQRPEEAPVPSMPARAVCGDDVDAVLSLDEIADRIRNRPQPARRLGPVPAEAAPRASAEAKTARRGA